MNAQGSLIPRLFAALALAALASCSPPELQDTAPRSDFAEAPPAYAPPAPPPEPPSETALLGGPRNPPPAPRPPPAYAPPPAPEFTPFEMAPIPNPPEPEQARPAPVHAASSAEAIAPRPARNTAAKPTAKAAALAAADTPVAKLGTALATDVASGSRLSIPDGLSSGRDGIVVLSLPDNLAARLKDEAAKLGLGAAAGTASIRATLSGQGYDITPSESQVARLGDQPVKFSWQVSETTDASVEKLPLRADISGEVKAGRAIQGFPLASLGALPPSSQKAGAADAGAAFKAADGLALAIPLLLILIALFILGRWAKVRQADKDRRRATLAEFHT